jgi:hypothetical protein
MPRLLRRAPLIGVAVVTMALIAGCTTSTWDTSAADHPTTTVPKHYPNTTAGLEASITDHLSAVGPDLNQWAPPRDQAHCAAVKIVTRLGLNRLLDLGYQSQVGGLALPYSDDERTSLTGILVGCINFQDGLLSLISSYGKLAVEPAECVTDGIGRQGLTQAFAAGFLAGDQPDPFARNNQLAAGMGTLLAQCLTPATDLVPGSPVARFPSELNPTTTTRTSQKSTTTSSAPTSTTG